MMSLMVPTASMAGKGPCTDDKLKFCTGPNGSTEGIRNCLLQHKDELSDVCEARLGEAGVPER
jgi:hypothetical protein